MKKALIISIGIVVVAVGGGIALFSNKATNQPIAQTPQTTIPSTNTNQDQNQNKNPSQNQNQNTGTTQEKPTTFTLAVVAQHNSRTSCYSVIRGEVYDLTNWISRHPGGAGAILGICGRDATEDFTEQHGGQDRPEATLAGFRIGSLVQ